MAVVFREYAEQEYPELLEMVMALYNEDDEGKPMNEEKLRKTIDEYLNNPQKLSIQMIVKDHHVIGYSILVFYWSNEYGGDILNIDELYIKEAYRNQGIGTFFIQEIAKRKDIVAIQLETTPSNQRAYNYYKQLGFKPSENHHLIKEQ